MINPTFASNTYHAGYMYYPNIGIKGNGTNAYIDTKFNPFTQGVNFTAQSQCIWVWINSRNTGTDFQMYAGNNGGGFSSYITTVAGNVTEGWTHNLNTNFTESPYPLGLILFRKTSNGVREIWHNGVLKATNTQITNGVSNYKFYELTWNNANNAGYFSDATIAMSGYCSGDINPTLIYENVKELATSIGFENNLENSLQYHFPFDGNSNELIQAIPTVDTDMTYNSGKINSCAYFNGSSSKITLSNDIIFTADFTVAFWIKPPTENLGSCNRSYYFYIMWYLLLQLCSVYWNF